MKIDSNEIAPDVLNDEKKNEIETNLKNESKHFSVMWWDSDFTKAIALPEDNASRRNVINTR